MTKYDYSDIGSTVVLPDGRQAVIEDVLSEVGKGQKVRCWVGGGFAWFDTSEVEQERRNV